MNERAQLQADAYTANQPDCVPYHALANAFPMFSGERREEVREDIRRNGVRLPVYLFEGAILDGRNRYELAREAGVAVRFEAFAGTWKEARDLVISLNLARRDLDKSQRAAALAELETLTHGGDRRGDDAGKDATRKELAERGNVSERSIARAAVVRDQGAPELFDAVKAGAVPVAVAADLTELTPGEQVEIVARGAKEILKAAADIRAAKQVRRKAERIEKINRIARGNGDLPTAIRYPVIYADPPWRYENPHMGVTGRGIENHYPTMSLDDICALPVKDLATPDAVLFLWVTVPHTYWSVPRLLDAWGFTFRSEIVWDKEVAGLGYWTRGQHEKLLICSRGKFPDFHGADCPVSVYRERRGEHSAKPDYFAALIEKLTPGLPRIELFARGPRPGWDVWGNQAAADPAPAADAPASPPPDDDDGEDLRPRHEREAEAEDAEVPAFVKRSLAGGPEAVR